MSRIFLSYRRADSQTITGRIYDRLVVVFGKDSIFKDVDRIPPGLDFPTVLQEAVNNCLIQLVIIGPQWTRIPDASGNPRLANPNDFVRQEVESALPQEGITVIPVLVSNAEMPTREELPSPTLQLLTRRNAVRIREDPDFHRDMDRLIPQLQAILAADEMAAQKSRAADSLGIRSWLSGGPRLRVWIVGVAILALAALSLWLLAKLDGRGGQLSPSLSQDFVGTSVASNNEWLPVIEASEGVEMALVPAGCFMMGSNAPVAASSEQPVHEVCFEESFWIDRYEVSNVQFEQRGGVAGRASRWGESEQPREQITWFEARDFCEQRGARLPTEAEWEYAARGPDSLTYPWGNQFDCSAGNFDDDTIIDNRTHGEPGCDGYSGTAPVGTFPNGASWVGAQDMSGNVWEWVADWQGAYSAEPQVDPEGPESGETRVLRGGSWGSPLPEELRSALRLANIPEFRSGGYGVRCARDP